MLGQHCGCLWPADKQHASLSSKLSLTSSKDSWEISFEAAELSGRESKNDGDLSPLKKRSEAASSWKKEKKNLTIQT